MSLKIALTTNYLEEWKMSENLDKKLAELQETIDGDCDFVGRVKRNGQTMHSEEVVVDFMQMASRL